MLIYLTIVVVLVGSSSGSIINCCHQGQSVGNRQIKGPHCVEKNIDYDVVGRVSRGMCKAVFLSCCQSSAMDQYCKLGVQAAINGAKCSNASGLGGDMKSTCCVCCKNGIDAANRGESCNSGKKGEMLCEDSFNACCTNSKTSIVTTKVPKVTTPAKVLNCKDHGCEQSCSEVDGDVKCECNAGYSLKVDGKSCEDIDECSEGLAACGDGDLCQNQAGAYVCVKQPAIKEKPCSKEGYIRNSDGKCVDEDECAAGTAICRADQYCINTDGFYACFRNCPYGYRTFGRRCVDVDECALYKPCQLHYKCINKKGHYACVRVSCPRGYQLKNERCEDVDECASGIHKCTERYTCQNTVGFYKCKLSSCARGFKLAAGRCIDINECQEFTNVCGPGRCYNSYGGYNCVCYPGYQFNSTLSKCEDVDECTRSPGICESGCMNTQGSYRCICPQGYQSFGNNCEDIDECALFSSRCPSDHECVNDYGSFTCINTTCPSKFYIQRTPYECKLMCPGNQGKCADLIIQSIKWTASKFRKIVNPNGFVFTYSLRVSSYINVQVNFELVSGNEGGEFFLQRQSEQRVQIVNIKKLIGPRRYTLRLDANVMYNGRVTSKFVYFNYIFVSKYSF